MNKSREVRPLADMPEDEFRKQADAVVDWVARYLSDPEAYPVFSGVAPGATLDGIPSEAPEDPESFDRIFTDFRERIVPGITHWNHPGFFAWFATSAAGPGILGELMAAALNVNAMLWRASPSATELEQQTLDWLRQMLGLPAGFTGHIQDTASTSTMVALGAARQAVDVDVRREGLAGRGTAMRVYCSEQAHSSVDKAAITLGLGLAGVRRIPVDDSFRMSPSGLAQAIREDREANVLPMAVVATVGTTSTTSVDPVDEIADICAESGVWLHVDAAYGGAAALVPGMRRLMAGWDRADSIVTNPHKWMFVPLDCSALFFRDAAAAVRAWSLTPDYLATPEDAAVTNLMEYGPALGRRFRALKLWMTLRYFGRTGLAARLEEHMRLARLFAGWVDQEDSWSLEAPVPFSAVCFRYAPNGFPASELDRANEGILDRVNASGEVFLSHTRLRGRFVLRLAIGNIRTGERQVARAWDLLREASKVAS